MKQREYYCFILGCCVMAIILNLANGHDITLPIFGSLSVTYMLFQNKFDEKDTERHLSVTEFPRPCCLCKIGKVDICNCGCAEGGASTYVCSNCNGSEESILGMFEENQGEGEWGAA